MQNWELFENRVLNFLNSLFSEDKNISFVGAGGSNSSEPDIKVYFDGILQFSIETKLSPAQAGQFVIKKDTDFFSESLQSRFRNRITQEIVAFLNQNVLLFDKITQSAIPVQCDDKIICEWIKEHYKNKDSRFIITSNSLSDRLNICSVGDIGLFFDASAVARRKKSGSRDVPRKSINYAVSELTNHFLLYGQSLVSFKVDEGKLTVQSDNFEELVGQQKYFANNGFFLSAMEPPGHYTVKALSKTNNMNVVFTLCLKNDIVPNQESIREFILKELHSKNS